MGIERLKKSIRRKFEMRNIKRIIRDTRQNHPPKNEMQDECDMVFVRRLETNREALRMSYWENHFEWKAVLLYPEINGRVLDFGCGSGHSDIFLARHGLTIHGIDLSPVGIALAESMRQEEPEPAKSRVSFSVSDVIGDTPHQEKFDAAWSSHVFEHIENPEPILSGLKNWVKPNAPILISVPFGNAYDDPGHVNHFYSTNDFVDFLGDRVIVDKIDICNQFDVIRTVCRLK